MNSFARWVHRGLLALAVTASATASGAQQLRLEDVVEVDLLPGWETRDGSRMAAVRISLAPGWKTYWRAPGDAGIPPEFDWSGSKNVGQVSTHWPRPVVFATSGYRTLGYEREVVFPLEITPKSAGRPIEIAARVNLGICEDICVPVSVQLAGVLDGKGRSDPAIHAALADRPVDAKRAGVSSARCVFQPISDGLQMTAEITMPKIGRREVAAVEAGDPRIWVSEAKVARRGKTLTLVADLVPPRGGSTVVDRKGLRFTILGDRQAVDIRGCSAG